MSAARSMTGFAAVEGTLPDGRGFSLTLKGVNHRHLDLALRLPPGFDALEPALRQTIKAGVRRGHVELTLVLEKTSAGATVQVDEVLLNAYVEAYRQAAARHGISAAPDLNALLRSPGVMSAAALPPESAAAEPAMLDAAVRAVAQLNQARTCEGQALAAELSAAMSRVAEMAAEARRLREGVAAAQAARLRVRFQEVLAGLGEVGEDRILAEAALLAERGDVEEELVRLRTHLARFQELLEKGGELGRPLDFLLQELNREANTLLSKTGGAAGGNGLRLTEIGLAIKLELERAREQVQNLE